MGCLRQINCNNANLNLDVLLSFISYDTNTEFNYLVFITSFLIYFFTSIVRCCELEEHHILIGARLIIFQFEIFLTQLKYFQASQLCLVEGVRSRARHLARLGLRRHRHQDTDKHIDRRHRWAVIGGPEQDNTQYSPPIGPSETRQPGRSPSSGEKMTAWRTVWKSLRGPRTGDTRWWPRLSPTKTYRWVSRPSRGITFWRHLQHVPKNLYK